MIACWLLKVPLGQLCGDQRGGRESSQELSHRPVIPAFERLTQEDLAFKARLGYIEKPCLKKKSSGRHSGGRGSVTCSVPSGASSRAPHCLQNQDQLYIFCF
jgi:hypothetical protein